MTTLADKLKKGGARGGNINSPQSVAARKAADTSGSVPYDVPSNGYFANSGLDWGNAENPHFLEREVHHGNYGYGAHKLFRGSMTQLRKFSGAPHRYKLNFLWNPGAISTVFGFDTERTVNTDADNRGVPNLLNGMNLSFQLMFVRQREMGLSVTEDPTQGLGCLADAGHLERMLSSDPAHPESNSGILTQQPMLVTFGKTASGTPWQWSGWITGCSIQYLMFTSNMIPTIVQADITFTRQFAGGHTGGGTPTLKNKSNGGSTISQKTPPLR